MARPQKPASERRIRWDKLYVTEAERANITAAAASDLTVSRYLIAAHRGATRPAAARVTMEA